MLKISEKFTLDNLNEHFTKLNPLPYIDLKLSTTKRKFDFRLTAPQEVKKIIMKIKSNSTGPDGIPPKCYKLMIDHIIEPISMIINS